MRGAHAPLGARQGGKIPADRLYQRHSRTIHELLMSFLSIFGTIRLAPFGRHLTRGEKSIFRRRI
jgi:hypothetical protein